MRFTITDAASGATGAPIQVVGATLSPVWPPPLSSDGKTLVLLDSTKNELRFLDTQTGKDRFRVPAFRRPVKTFAFSPDGRLMAAATGGATGPFDKTIVAPSEVAIWHAAT